MGVKIACEFLPNNPLIEKLVEGKASPQWHHIDSEATQFQFSSSITMGFANQSKADITAEYNRPSEQMPNPGNPLGITEKTHDTYLLRVFSQAVPESCGEATLIG